MKVYDNIDDAYNYLYYIIKSQGKKIVDQRGDIVYQLSFIPLMFENHINDYGYAQMVKIPQNTIFNNEGLQRYTEQLLDGELHDFVYTYGHRLMTYFDVDQYDVIVKRLQENKDTRRAIAITYDPEHDTYIEDIPCLIMIKCSIYDNKLDMGVVFRSNDIRYAFTSNMYALMNVQLRIAKELGIKVGKFYYTGFDSHWKEDKG